MFRVKQATKQGWIECVPYGIADISFPTSKLRRGRVQGGGEIAPTICTSSGLVRLEGDNMATLRIRKLTPTETGRLMGLTDEHVESCRNVGVSNSQLYKQHGNGIVSDCVKLLMEHLYKAQYDENYETTDEKMVKQGYGC